ncbi:MAG: hypothetical protein PHF51_02155 [Candidatus ainarchaeum sp.]|nr:hypothetical protein [Candidatus ainarchaeum sp.]
MKMCRLCDFAHASTDYQELMERAFVSDLDRMIASKKDWPDNRFVFTNLAKWDKIRFDFALFEPLAAIPNPENYYQGVWVDSEKRGSSWESGWGRSFGFTRDGKLLLYTKATMHTKFRPEDEWFKYFFLVEFEPAQLSLVMNPPKFIIRADEVKLKGQNLLTNEESEHSFSFIFSHLATEKSAMLPEAVKQSAFYRKVLRRGKPKKDDGEQRSDFERYTVTTPYYAPHPFLMQFFQELGYETRFDFQVAIPKFVEEHFSALGARPAPSDDALNPGPSP